MKFTNASDLAPVTGPSEWLRHERATRAAQLMLPLLLKAGRDDTASEWAEWMIALHEEKAIDRC